MTERKKIDVLLERLAGIEQQLEQVQSQIKVFREISSVPLELKKLAAQDAARYISENFSNVQVFTYRHETLKYAIQLAENEGDFLEFGVHTGGTISLAAKLRPDTQFWGFDSFEGLPEDWEGTSRSKGDFDLKGKLPEVPSNVTLVKGWFNPTFPK